MSPDPADEPARRRGTFRGPIRLTLCAALLFGGGVLVVRGWQRSVVHDEVRRVATTFLEAVRDGDVLAAHALLVDERRERHAKVLAAGQRVEQPSATVRITTIRLDGQRAIVESEVEMQGYVIEPVLELVRSDTREWRIARVSRLEVDPRWIDRYESTLHDNDRAMTDRLREQFSGRH